jgi:large subunit ribosomal protein L3
MAALQHAEKNSIGVMGVKLGTTHRYDENGNVHIITVLRCDDMPVIQKKTPSKDGYAAVQVSYGNKKNKNKAIIGHFKDQKAEGSLVEFRLDEEYKDSMVTMQVLDHIFSVKVTAKSKGKGFAGPVKRWGFRTQDATHGNSLSHRAHGSTGQCQFPGRVFKGKKMAGRMGHTQVSIKNLEIFKLDHENKLLYIKGSVPGSVGTYVRVQPYLLKDGEK